METTARAPPPFLDVYRRWITQQILQVRGSVRCERGAHADNRHALVQDRNSLSSFAISSMPQLPGRSLSA